MAHKRLYPAIALLSVSIISFQLSLMQILNHIQWSHFAYLVISLALLGFGASGTVIALFRKWFVKRSVTIIPLFMSLSGLFMALTLVLTNHILDGFDSFLLFNQPEQTAKLALACFIFMLPFFFGGAALGLIYTVYSSQIGRLYFADLAGSGLGGALFTGMIWILFPDKIVFLISALPLISAFLASTANRTKMTGLLLSFAAAILFFSFDTKDLPVSQFKSLEKTLTMQDAEILYEKSSPYGRIHVVSAPSARFAPGLSLAWEKSLPPSLLLFNNGNWFGAISTAPDQEKVKYYDYTMMALPFVAGKPENVLVLDAGSGSLGAYSLWKGSNRVTLVETNAAAIILMKNELAAIHDSLFYHPSLFLKQTSSRSYLLSDTNLYDLILFPDAGTFGGSTGMMASEENYLLTREAFQDAWDRLDEEGYLLITAWMDYPVRVPLKMLSLIAELLYVNVPETPEKHLVVLRSWGNMGFLVKKSQFCKTEKEKILEFSNHMFFDPMIPEDLIEKDATTFNFLQNENLREYAGKILRGDTKSLFGDYEFDIAPASDNRPFFYRFMKPSKIKILRNTYSFQELAYMEPGYFLTFIVFFVILALSLLLIFVPMLFMKIKGRGIPFTLLYFGGLGVGFMFVEIVFIQQFILYLGEPIYSAAAIISGILLFSGAGSYTSSRFPAKRKILSINLLIIVPLIVLYALLLGVILRNTVHLSMILKILLTLALISPPSFFMGMAFPLGVRLLSGMNESLIPWAWGINGYLSVISAVLAILISFHTGFMMVLVLAALAYLIAYISGRLLTKG
jgi:spermidine synthase